MAAWIIGILSLCIANLSAQTPAKDYSLKMLAGWTIMVNPELLDEEPEEADSAYSHLLVELIEIEEILPDAAIARLKAMPIWLEHETPNDQPIQTHRTKDWLVKNGYIAEKARTIEVVAEAYNDESYRSWFPLLSHLMHAYYLRHVNDSNAILMAAFNQAKSLPVYMKEDSDFKPNDPSHYYFLTSMAYFTSNWVEPIDRENLLEVDSVGYEMVRTLWQDEGKIYELPTEGRYVETDVLGWRLAVDTQLVDRDTSLLKEALGLLGKGLNEINQTIPSPALAMIQEAKIYVVKFEGGWHAGRYWPKAFIGSRSAGTKRRAGNLEVIAGRYIDAIRIWKKSLLMHELAHAYHDRLSDEDDAMVEDAYERAMKQGLYRGRYANTNQYEYFAELTTMYFGKNSYFPADRFDLRGYDPRGYRMIEKVWGVAKN